MKPSLISRLDSGTRQLLPLISTIALLLAAASPTRLPGYATVAPMIGLMAITYWAIYRPDLLGGGTAFLLGILQDILFGMPVGVNALIFLLAHGVTASQQRFFLGHPFLVIWWGFGLIAAGAAVLTWLLMTLIFKNPTPGNLILLQYAMTLAIYPPLTWLLARLQAAVLRDA